MVDVRDGPGGACRQGLGFDQIQCQRLLDHHRKIALQHLQGDLGVGRGGRRDDYSGHAAGVEHVGPGRVQCTVGGDQIAAPWIAAGHGREADPWELSDGGDERAAPMAGADQSQRYRLLAQAAATGFAGSPEYAPSVHSRKRRKPSSNSTFGS